MKEQQIRTDEVLIDFGGRSYFVVERELHSCDQKTGVEETVAVAGELIADLAKVDETILFGNMHRGSLYSFNPAAGKQNQIAKVDGHIVGLAKLDGLLYFGAGCEFCSYDLKTGKGKTLLNAKEQVEKLVKYRNSFYLKVGQEAYSYNLATNECEKIA